MGTGWETGSQGYGVSRDTGTGTGTPPAPTRRYPHRALNANSTPKSTLLQYHSSTQPQQARDPSLDGRSLAACATYGPSHGALGPGDPPESTGSTPLQPIHGGHAYPRGCQILRVPGGDQHRPDEQAKGRSRLWDVPALGGGVAHVGRVRRVTRLGA